jgi:hypothetical protein
MATTLAGPRAPRHHIDPLAAVDTSPDLREFREVTALLGQRFALPGLNDMRAEKRPCVHALVTRFLYSARLALLPRAWAERFVVHVQATVERVWGTDLVDVTTARQLAVAAECEENVAEIEGAAPHPDRNDEMTDLMREASAVRAELAADRVRLVALEKRIATLRREGAVLLV